MAPEDTPHVQAYLQPEDLHRALIADAGAGLIKSPPQLSPMWLYDPAGADLFDKITELPEYYPTRTERSILAEHADDVARLTGAQEVIELGSGTSEKTTLLLDALKAKGTLRRFVAWDVAEPTLRMSLLDLQRRYPKVHVEGVVADFVSDIRRLPAGEQRMVVFLGGTIGNFDPAGRRRFLSSLRAELHAGEWLLLGTDLVKDPSRLVAAYDDPAGVTAAFDLNVLSALNHQLGSDFDAADFAHQAHWDDSEERIEMRLVAQRDLHTRIDRLDLDFRLAAGAFIRTEISSKFRTERLQEELGQAGLETVEVFTDPRRDFAVTLARAGGS